MKIKLLKKPKPAPPKRMPGQRAGLKRELIVTAAIKLSEQDPHLSVGRIAAALDVAPGTITAHFPGKLPELLTEMARTLIGTLAPPFHPKQTWDNYLGGLFFSLSQKLHRHRNLAQLVGLELSADYFMSPLLVERILLALELAGVPPKRRAQALDLVIGSLIGFIAIECSNFGSRTPAAWAAGMSSKMDTLPAEEHPQIKGLQVELAAAGAERAHSAAAPEPSAERAQRFADFLIAGLKELSGSGE